MKIQLNKITYLWPYLKGLIQTCWAFFIASYWQSKKSPHKYLFEAKIFLGGLFVFVLFKCGFAFQAILQLEKKNSHKTGAIEAFLAINNKEMEFGFFLLVIVVPILLFFMFAGIGKSIAAKAKEDHPEILEQNKQRWKALKEQKNLKTSIPACDSPFIKKSKRL